MRALLIAQSRNNKYYIYNKHTTSRQQIKHQ